MRFTVGDFLLNVWDMVWVRGYAGGRRGFMSVANGGVEMSGGGEVDEVLRPDMDVASTALLFNVCGELWVINSC